MASVLIPVSLSLLLGPGVGQLYNKEYRKGTYLIVLSLIVLVAACFWCFKAAQPYLPTEIQSIDPAALQEMLKHAAAEVSKEHGHTLLTYQFILMALWAYGVYDAAIGGLRRRVQPPK